MKKIVTLFFIVCTLSLMAQVNFSVSGTITDEFDGTPIQNKSVYISLYDMNDTTALIICDVMVTNENGFYEYTGSFDFEVALLEVGTVDCNMEYLSFEFALTSGNSSIIQDFEICINYLAYFTYSQVDEFTIEFTNLSIGENLNYYWYFGDDTESQEENPTHTYNDHSFEMYSVLLIIVNDDSTLIDYYEDFVVIGDLLPGECYAMFRNDNLPNNYLTVLYTDLSITSNDLPPDSWYWGFGDGSDSYEQNPHHTYDTAGIYNVYLMITSGNHESIYYTDVCVYEPEYYCQAEFTYYITGDTTEGLTYQFVDISSGSTTEWNWSFGDGTSSSEQNPVHTFSEADIYDVCLSIISNDSTCFDFYCEFIIIGNSNTCIAQFAYYPDESQLDYTLQFIDLSYGDIENWYWDFGDGIYSYERDPVHTFSEEGYYFVCLTIAGENCQSVWCEDVYVAPYEECFNYFSYESAGNSVLFDGFHSNTIPENYYWHFGDGTTGEGQIVSHTYASTGTYFVSLSTSDDDLCYATSSQMIVVGDSIEYNQIYGQVFEGDFPLDEGFVMIFSMDTDDNYIPFFDVTMINTSGIYLFPYVPNGIFAVYAIPFYFNEYMPTYYGDVVNWDKATPIVLGDPNNPYNIHLVPVDAATDPGNGTITGIISDPAVRQGFIDKIKILLYNENYELIDFTDVNTEGSFNISNLANGTYYIYPELTGVTSSFMRADISDEQQEVVVNMTMDGNSILGNKELFTVTEAGDIFPNPAGRNAKVELMNQKSTVVTVQVLDITGRNHSILEYNLNAGRSVIDIPVKSLQTGLYIVRISNTEGDVITKKVIRQ